VGGRRGRGRGGGGDGTGVGARQVQARLPGGPVRRQDQHHHPLHVRQVRQHLPGTAARTPSSPAPIPIDPSSAVRVISPRRGWVSGLDPIGRARSSAGGSVGRCGSGAG